MKLLASDFDGTLFFLNEKEPYRQGDVKAIEEFQKAGNLFGICTGRPLLGIIDMGPELFHFDFYILNSGAVVLDKKQQVIFKKTIPITVLYDIMDLYPHLDTFIVTETGLYINHPKREMNNEIVKTIEDKSVLKNQVLLGFSFHVTDKKELKEVMATLSDYPELSVYQNRSDIDCVAYGCSKKTGIDMIAQHFGLEDDQIACIGDSYNDLPMLMGLTNSFTFHNSPESVKVAAKYHVNSVEECIDILMK